LPPVLPGVPRRLDSLDTVARITRPKSNSFDSVERIRSPETPAGGNCAIASRVDLLFFHRRLRCLVIFDLKLGRFTHAELLHTQTTVDR
jgi:hypothetical protein